MDKEDWSILIGILVLIVTSTGVFIAYQTYSVVEPIEDIDFFVGDVSKKTGTIISMYLSYLCIFRSLEGNLITTKKL